jgi:hypothetical protein
VRRLRHEKTDITGVADPSGLFHPVDSAGGVTLPDEVADHLLAFPGWQLAEDEPPEQIPTPVPAVADRRRRRAQ